MARRYSIEGPDKHLYEFDGPENASKEQIMGYAKQLFDKRQASMETAGVGEAFVGGTKRMLSSLGTGISGMFNAEEAAKAGEERQKAITERSGASLDKISQVYDEKGLFPAAREVISQVPSAIAQQAPQLAAALGTARLGATAGSAFGPAGTIVGGLAGAFLPSFIQQSGTNLERQAQEGKPIEAGAAYSAAVPQAALDVFTDKLLFSKLMGLPVKTLGRAEADAVVAKSLKRTLAEGTAKGIAAEVPTEVAQQMLERYQAGLSLTDDEARKEYADIAYQTALTGPLGAIGNFQERGEAKQVITQDQAIQDQAAQQAQAQAQREATGVMDQQPLFTEEEAPRPAGPVLPEGYTPSEQEETEIPEPTTTIPDVEAPAQGELFTPRGMPSPEALASVETGRLQSLPAQIAELNTTPEGRAELAGNMKLYFPDLSDKERNKTRQAIQQGIYGVEPVAPAEGTLTPELLKSFGIKSGPNYKSLLNANLADPTTYNLLTVLASTNTNIGVNANRILEAFPHYNPNAVQPDLFGVPNAPQTQPTAEPTQSDLFGFPEDGIQATTEQPGTKQSVGMPVQPEETTSEETPEPDGAGVDGDSGVPQPNVGAVGPSTAGQPSALAPVPKSVAKDAASTLKKEPVATTWTYFSDVPFAKLSKIGKDKVKQAHADGYLTQDLADEIESIEAANATKAGISTKIATGSPEMATQVLTRQLDEAVASQQDLEADPTATQAKKDTAAKKVDRVQKQLAKLQKQLDKITTDEASVAPSEAPAQDRGNEQNMPEVKYVEKNLTGKSQVEAARWIAENAPNKSYRVIAEKVADMLERLKAAGVNQRFTIVRIGDQVPGALNKFGVLGMSSYSYGTKDPYVHVYLKGTDFSEGNIGTTYETALHELIHAATQAAITQGSKVSSMGTEFGKDVDNLISLFNVVVNHFKARVKESQEGGTTLTPFEQSITRGANAIRNIRELVSWGLTNAEMQEYLEAIPYKSDRSLWSEIVNAIRSLLGLPAPANTALSELLSVSESLLNTDVSALKNFAESKGDSLHQINPVAQAQARQFIAGMSGTLAQSVPRQTTTTAQVLGNITTTMVNNPSGALGMVEELANKFRTKVIDKAANLSAAIQDANAGAFYNMNGQIRADLLLSAANNVNNFINAVFTRGGMEILPNGSMRAKDANHSVDGVFRHAQRLGEQLGVEDARALITDAFYHYRAKSIIDNVPRNQWPENWQNDPRIVPTQAQINAAMAAFNQFPELRAMQTEFIGAKNEMVKFLKQSGFLSDEKATQFLADDSYAPWLRLKDYQDQIPGLGNTGRMVDLRQMKALVGGTEEVNDMLENMAQMIGWCVRSGVGNHTANSALNTMSTMGTATRSNSRPTTGNPAHVVMTYEAGKPVYWTVDNPYDLAAFQTVSGLNSGVIKELGKWLGRLRAGIVLFPAFPLRQVVMDSQRAFIESGVDKPWAMMGKIYSSFLTGEAFRGSNADIQELMNQGVIGSVDYTAYDSTRGRASQFGMGEAPKTISDKFVATSGYQFLQKLAYSADLAVRLGIYRQTMEETGDRTLAATRAREIINFQKSGTSTFVNTLKQTIPFMGAYLQGMDVNYKGMVGRGNSMKQRKAAAAAYWGNMAMYAGLVTLYTMSRSGDDDYEEQKGFITDRNFVIPGGGLIPVPTDVGFLGKVIPERITDYVLQSGTENPESLTRLRQGILEAAAAGFTPPAAVYGVIPAIELTTNYSFFSDMPIVSERMKGLEPFQQYTASTSEFAKNVGDTINFSPIKIDYMFNAIGGTSAGALLQLADVMMGSNKMAADKTPIIGSFQQKTVGGRYAEEYYATRELVERAYNTAKALQAEGDEAKLEEYISRPEIQARLAARDGIEALHTSMNEVSQQRNAIMNSPDLTPEEKRQAVNELLASVEAGLRDMQIRRIRSELE